MESSILPAQIERARSKEESDFRKTKRWKQKYNNFDVTFLKDDYSSSVDSAKKSG